MQVITAGHTGGPGQTYNRTLFQQFVRGNADLTQVGVEAENTLAVVQNDGIAVDAEIICKDNLAAVGGLDFGLFC